MANYQLQATIARQNEAKYMTYLRKTFVILQTQMCLTNEEFASFVHKELGITVKDFEKIMGVRYENI